jgi:methionine synthase I (cobalamin-dependent)
MLFGSMDLLAAIDSHPFAGDGDLRTLLKTPGTFPEGACLSSADEVEAAHKAFIEAGARVFRTNSRNANGPTLAANGLTGHVNELNWTASQIARSAAKGHDVVVAGCVGQLAAGTTGGEGSLAIYLEQIGALLDGGANAVLFDGFNDFKELGFALEAKQTLHHCPSICLLAIPSPTSCDMEKARDLGADVVGVVVLAGAATAHPAGADAIAVGSASDASISTEHFLQIAIPASGLGARLIMGGNAATVDNIRALASALKHELEEAEPSR